MFKQRSWQILLVSLALVASYFSLTSYILMYQYARLDTRTVPESVHWSSHALNNERYVLKANYVFRVKDRNYTNEALLLNPWYRNEWAAEQEIPIQMKKNWEIWFSSSNPESSSLQKIFPTKECVSSILLWGIFVYFVLLGLYMEKVSHVTDRFKKS